jgi:hypothetical protein
MELLWKIWHYNRTNTAAIQKSMINFSWQVKTFTDIFVNIMSQLLPSEIK